MDIKEYDDGKVSTKVGIMVFDMKGGNRFVRKSLRSKNLVWSYKPAFNEALESLQKEASFEYKALKKGFA